MHKKMEDLTDIKNKLIQWTKSEIDKDGAPSSLEEIKVMGEVVDMVKDIAEAEEKCWKACYYKEIVCAMDDERGDMGGERMGYNPRRYASGRYAPSGRGHMGYVPGIPSDHMSGPYMRMMDDRYDGYTPSGEGNRSQSGSRMGYTDDHTAYSPYERYKDARRHYTETRTPEDKRRMEQHADEHIHKATESIKDIWRDADPEMKARLKSQMTKLVNEMN